MCNYTMKLTNVSRKISKEHPGYIKVTLNGTDERGHLRRHSFLSDKSYQLVGLCEYLGCQDFAALDNMSGVVATIAMAKKEAVAINKNNSSKWLLLGTGKVINKNVVDSIVSTIESN